MIPTYIRSAIALITLLKRYKRKMMKSKMLQHTNQCRMGWNQWSVVSFKWYSGIKTCLLYDYGHTPLWVRCLRVDFTNHWHAQVWILWWVAPEWCLCPIDWAGVVKTESHGCRNSWKILWISVFQGCSYFSKNNTMGVCMPVFLLQVSFSHS